MKNATLLLTLLIISMTSSSCFQNLFKVQTSNSWNQSHIDSLKYSNKAIVVHFRNDIKTMLTPTFDSNQISGQLGEYRRLYTRENKPSYPKKVNAYKKRDRSTVFGQVHVYVSEDFAGQNAITINRDNFAWTNLYAHDPKATATNHNISVGIIGAIIAGIAVGAMAIDASFTMGGLGSGDHR